VPTTDVFPKVEVVFLPIGKVQMLPLCDRKTHFRSDYGKITL
jgi:hypothetical protein